MWCSVDDIVGKKWGNRSLKSHLSYVKEEEDEKIIILSGNGNGNSNSNGIVGIGNGGNNNNNNNDYVSSNSVLKESRCVRVFDKVRKLRCHHNSTKNSSISVIGANINNNSSSLLSGKSSKKILTNKNNNNNSNKKKKLYFDYLCGGKKKVREKKYVAEKVRNVVVKKYEKTSAAASLDKIKKLQNSATDLTDYKIIINKKNNNEDNKKIKNKWYNDDGGGGDVDYDDENDDDDNDNGRCRISEKSSYGNNNNELEERVMLLEERLLPSIVAASSSTSSSNNNDTLSTTTSSTFLRNGKSTTTTTTTSAIPETTTSSPILNDNKKYSYYSSGRPKIDMPLPTLKSLVTMTTNKISTNSSSNRTTTTAATMMIMGPKYSNIRRNTSLDNVNIEKHNFNNNYYKNNLRKCSTMITLEGIQGTEGKSYKCPVNMKGIHPINRLRIDKRDDDKMERTCSRCSSLLSMASSSKYSINSNLGFVPVNNNNNYNYNNRSNYCSVNNINNSSMMINNMVSCKVCLNEVQIKDSWTLQHCQCSYCVQCVRSYVEFEINQGAFSISCPDAECEKQGIIFLEEVESLVSLEIVEKHKRYRLNKEVEMDKSRTWCPKPGCETVCTLSYPDKTSPQSVNCPTCMSNFCSNCRVEWHPGSPCKTEDAVPGISFDSELIKCCPMCSVPIEKDEGCAQMLCKRCKHVFCWYCLASLDDDFLLRHYDKGPCKNKLGHSRASVIWHRAQVISIFAGFGILLLIASPLLLLAAPCIVCCKCRVCTSDSKLDTDEDIISVSGDIAQDTIINNDMAIKPDGNDDVDGKTENNKSSTPSTEIIL